MIDQAEIAELRELEAKATPGEWRAGSFETEHVFAPNRDPERIGDEYVLLKMNHHFVRFEGDARLIAAARNALPKLLDAAERCARLEALLSDIRDVDAAWYSLSRPMQDRIRAELEPPAQLDAADREPGEDEQRHDHDDRT